MGTILKLIGGAVLAIVVLLGVGLWDLTFNSGRLFYRIAGRDALVQDCKRPLRDNLIGRGFSPVDIAFGDDPSLSVASGTFGRSRSLSGSFSFSDGQDGPRIDGRIVCTVAGRSVDVDVEVDKLPRRVT